MPMKFIQDDEQSKKMTIGRERPSNKSIVGLIAPPFIIGFLPTGT